jgi:D-3-phosphoglycerate dehydrogenase / 2-oxoglutarate reductase
MSPVISNQRHIVVAEPEGFDPAALAALQTLGHVTVGPFDRETLIATLAEADVVMIRLAHRLDAALIAACPRLRTIVTPTTGLDHIDLAAAAAAGVAVLSLRGEDAFLRTVHATAEHTWALLLALIRNLPGSVRSVLDGAWDRDRFKGRELADRTLGLVGLGRIGSRVARYGRAFGMRVIAFDPDLDVWPPEVERMPSLIDLARQADVLSIHVHLGDATRGLIDGVVLAAMPAGGYLVNTSRGAIVDEEALLEALGRGHLAGAAVDVLSGELVPTESAARMLAFAREHDSLIITPHVGGATYDSMAKTERFMVEKLRRSLADVPETGVPAGRQPGR